VAVQWTRPTARRACWTHGLPLRLPNPPPTAAASTARSALDRPPGSYKAAASSVTRKTRESALAFNCQVLLTAPTRHRFGPQEQMAGVNDGTPRPAHASCQVDEAPSQKPCRPLAHRPLWLLVAAAPGMPPGRRRGRPRQRWWLLGHPNPLGQAVGMAFGDLGLMSVLALGARPPQPPVLVASLAVLASSGPCRQATTACRWLMASPGPDPGLRAQRRLHALPPHEAPRPAVVVSRPARGTSARGGRTGTGRRPG
jgi:hypothetical protein